MRLINPPSLAVALLHSVLIFSTANAAGLYDGTYAGTQTPMTSGGAGCGDGGAGTRTVVDNVLRQRWSNFDLRFPVAADGTINSTANAGPSLVSGKGKITGDTLVFETANQRCQFRFDGKKRG